MRVLLVEDQIASARTVCLALETNCYAIVDRVDTGEEALDLIRHYEYDLLILSDTLPDAGSLDVVRRMNAAVRQVPTLILSDLNSPDARVRALNAGADDILSKQFEQDELCARIEAIIRRSEGHSQSCLQIGPLRLNTETHDVSMNGTLLQLSGKEYAILELLATRRGSVLTKAQFLSHLYGGADEPEAKIVDVFICKLRKKLSQAGAPDLIGTVWGHGYTVRRAGDGQPSDIAAIPDLESRLFLDGGTTSHKASLDEFLLAQAKSVADESTSVPPGELVTA